MWQDILFRDVCLIALTLALFVSGIILLKKKEHKNLGICLSIVALVTSVMPLFLTGNSGRILSEEIMPGIFLDQEENLIKTNLPQNVRTIHKVGKPENSGYTIRRFRWIKLVYVEDKYDWRVAGYRTVCYKTEKEVVTCNGEIIPLNPTLKPLIKKISVADSWCPKKVKDAIEFVVLPQDKSGARIVKYIFM